MQVFKNGNESVKADVLIYCKIIIFLIRSLFLHTNTVTDFGEQASKFGLQDADNLVSFFLTNDVPLYTL